MNEKAAEIARNAVNQSNREAFVAGSMGPLGELIEPIGTLSMDEAIEAFTVQALALERGGCDVLWIETISSREELIAAATGASSSSLPFACNASFDTNGRTMMGISPNEIVEICLNLGVRPFCSRFKLWNWSGTNGCCRVGDWLRRFHPRSDT